MTPQNPILWLDTETGGFDPKAHDLLTTGLLLSIAGRSVQTWSHTIQRNEYRVTQSALETNGLNPDDLRRDGRPLSEVDAELSAAVHALLEQYPRLRLGGHNLCFDLGFIRAQLPELWAAIKEHDLHKRNRQVDTLHLAEAAIEAGYLRGNASLEALCEWYGVAQGEHDALGDARATSQVYDQIMRDLQGAGFVTVQAEVTGTAQVFSLKLPLVPRRAETLELGYKTYRVLSDPIYVMSESGYFEYVKIQLHFWDKTVRQP